MAKDHQRTLQRDPATGSGVDAMQDFLAMGGYALYVWGSYGALALLVVIEVYLVVHRRKILRAQLRRTLASLERVEE